MIELLIAFGIFTTQVTTMNQFIYDYCKDYEVETLYEEDTIYVEPVKMRVTCYLPTGHHTASGCYPFIGSCAGRKEDIGKVALIYSLDGEFLGAYEIRDCGGAKSLKNGTSLDLFMPDMKTAREWIKENGDYQMVQIIDADG